MPSLQYTNITTATTTLVRTGRARLVRIVVNKHIASNAISVYDAVTATNPIAIITPPATLTSPPNVTELDVMMHTGICIVTAGATDLTVVWRPA
jgi:hypothetical protein